MEHVMRNNGCYESIPSTVAKVKGCVKMDNILVQNKCGNIQFAYAYQFFKPDSPSGFCSAAHNDLFGKNADKKFNTQVIFFSSLNVPQS